MGYVIGELAPYLVLAFLIGIVVGWYARAS